MVHTEKKSNTKKYIYYNDQRTRPPLIKREIKAKQKEITKQTVGTMIRRLDVSEKGTKQRDSKETINSDI